MFNGLRLPCLIVQVWYMVLSDPRCYVISWSPQGDWWSVRVYINAETVASNNVDRSGDIIMSIPLNLCSHSAVLQGLTFAPWVFSYMYLRCPWSHKIHRVSVHETNESGGRACSILFRQNRDDVHWASRPRQAYFQEPLICWPELYSLRCHFQRQKLWS